MGFFDSVKNSLPSLPEAEVLEATKKASELGIYDIVRNIAMQGSNTDNPCEAVWEGCRLALNQSQVVNNIQTKVTSITMSNETLLYRGEESAVASIFGGGLLLVTDFRYGAWVDRIKTYSDQITAQKQQEATSKAQQEQEKKLKPFSGIDF